jgi:hypothetical protein
VRSEGSEDEAVAVHAQPLIAAFSLKTLSMLFSTSPVRD